MIAFNKDRTVAVHVWDWKEQPQWYGLIRVFDEFQSRGKLSIAEVDTGSDEYAIVITTGHITTQLARKHYEDHYDWDAE